MDTPKTKSLTVTLILLLLLIVLPGATCKDKKLFREAAKTSALKEAVLQSVKQDITGASDALACEQSTNRPVVLAKHFVQQAQQKVGLPDERVDVDRLMTLDRENLRYYLELRREETSVLLRGLTVQITEQRKTEEFLIDKGVEKVQEDRKKALFKWLFSMTGLLTIGGIIALCVFFPAAIPLILKLVMRGFRGVKQMTTGIGEALKDMEERDVESDQLVNVPKDKAWTNEEVRLALEKQSEKNARLLRDHLAKAMDGDVREHVRKVKPV